MSARTAQSRRQRCAALGIDAAARAKAAGKPVIACVQAQIDANFGASWWINELKDSVDRARARGALSPQNRLRYSDLAFAIRALDVDSAVAEIERIYRQETMRCARRDGPLFVVRVLSEARLFARWFRRFGDRAIYSDIIEALATEPRQPLPVHGFAADLAPPAVQAED